MSYFLKSGGTHGSSPTSGITNNRRKSLVTDHNRMRNQLCSLTLTYAPYAEAPTHRRGLGPRQRCFTCNYCQDSNKKLSVPLNKLVTHPTALSGGPYQASRNKIAEIGTHFFHTHAEALPILAVVPRTLPLLRASSSLSSTMAQQEHPLLRWRHLIDPPIHLIDPLIYLIDPHLYVIEAHFYLIEPLIGSIELHR